MPYRLVFKDISGYYEACYFCGQQRCGGCAVPYTQALSIEELLNKINTTSNESYFSDDKQTRGREL